MNRDFAYFLFGLRDTEAFASGIEKRGSRGCLAIVHIGGSRHAWISSPRSSGSRLPGGFHPEESQGPTRRSRRHTARWVPVPRPAAVLLVSVPPLWLSPGLGVGSWYLRRWRYPIVLLSRALYHSPEGHPCAPSCQRPWLKSPPCASEP